MPTPALLYQSTGSTDAGSGWTHTAPTSIAGYLIILQVLQDGATSGAVALTSVSNVENLAGTASAMTYIGEFPVGASSEAFQHLWVGRTTGGIPSFGGTNSTSEDLYIMAYVFSNVQNGTTLSAIIENSSAGTASNSTGTSSTASDTDVTTLGPNRLALNFVAVNDDNAIAGFTGMSGGTWAGATAYAESSGTDGAIRLQIATMNSAGTIGGGTASITDSDAWGVVGFALIGIQINLNHAQAQAIIKQTYPLGSTGINRGSSFASDDFEDWTDFTTNLSWNVNASYTSSAGKSFISDLTSGAHYGLKYLNSPTSKADVDIVVELNAASMASDDYGMGVCYRLALSYGFYIARIDRKTASTEVDLALFHSTYEHSSGFDPGIPGLTSIVSASTATVSNSANDLYLRVAAVGTKHYIKVWNTSDSEPQTWTIDGVTNSIWTGAGKVGVLDHTLTTGSSSTFINLIAYEAWEGQGPTFAQAQASITAGGGPTTYKVYAQSLAQIKVLANKVHAQSQTIIKTTYRGYAQVNASIKQTYPFGSSYTSTILADSPFAYWPLNETSGTTANDIIGTNDAVYSGGYTLSESPLISTETSVYFDGTNGRAVAVGDTIDYSDNTFSIEVWLKTNSPTGIGCVFSQSGNSGSQPFIKIDSNGTLRMGDNGVQNIAVSSSGYISSGSTYHIVWTKNGTTNTIYVNGTDATTDFTITNKTFVAPGSGDIVIGVNPNGSSEYFKGWIDEVAVYGSVLSGSQVSAHYQSGISEGIIGGTFAQAQASISVSAVATYRGYAQAQANIKQTYLAHAQSQTQIKRTFQIWAQGNSWIKQTYPISGTRFAYDTFTRTESNGWGTADEGGAWNSTNAVFSTDGTKGKVTISTNGLYRSTLTSTSQTNVDETIEWSVDKLPNSGSIHFWLEARTSGSNFYSGKIYIPASGTIRRWLTKNDSTDLGYLDLGTYTPGDTYLLRFAVIGSSLKMKTWKTGTAEPDWQVTNTDTSYTTTNSVGVGFYSNGPTNLPIVWTVDNYQAYDAELISPTFAQTQAQIKSTYQGYAQSQTQVKATYRGYAQAQTQIKATYRGYGQAQSQIKQKYLAYAQAQGQIKQTYRVWAQGQAQIKQTYQSYAQANAKIILLALQAYAQAQAQIKQTYTVWAQGNAKIILSNLQGYAQAQTWIKTTYPRSFDYSQIVLSDSPIAYWRLGEPSGTTADNAEGTTGFDGTYVGSPTLNSTGLLTGDADTAVILSGSGQYITVPDGAGMHWGDTFSVEFWIKYDTGSAYMTVFRKDDLDLGISRNNKCVAIYRNGSTLNANSTYNGVIAGSTYHIVVTKNGGSYATIYVNGLADTNISSVVTFTGGTNTAYIGSYNTTSDFVDGTLDEVTVYDYALTPQQVIAHYLAGTWGATFAQSQTSILATIQSVAQAQTQIIGIATYVAHAQAQAQVKQTFQGYAQALAQIKQTYRAYAQTQAHIKQTYPIPGINYTPYWTSGGEQGDFSNWYAISYPSLWSIVASPKNNGSYAIRFAAINTDVSYADPPPITPNSPYVVGKASFYFDDLPTTDVQSFIHVARNISDTKVLLGYDYATGKLALWTSAGGGWSSRILSDSAISADTWYTVDWKVDGQGSTADWKVNKVTQTQLTLPYTTATWNWVYLGQRGGVVLAQYTIYYDDFTFGTDASQYPIIDGEAIKYATEEAWSSVGTRPYAQSRARIKNTYRGYAQAQADIKQIYLGYAQAQALILATYVSCAQAQAQIKQTYRGYAQAQAQLKASYRGYAQGQAQIKATYQAWAQGNALIKTTYKTYAQAQAQIKTTYVVWAQGNAKIILSALTAYGQAQAAIKTTYLAYAQAQTKILLTALQAYAQAQSHIIVRDIEAFAQAGATISATGKGYAQAEVEIYIPQIARPIADISNDGNWVRTVRD